MAPCTSASGGRRGGGGGGRRLPPEPPAVARSVLCRSSDRRSTPPTGGGPRGGGRSRGEGFPPPRNASAPERHVDGRPEAGHGDAAVGPVHGLHGVRGVEEPPQLGGHRRAPAC